MIAVAIFELFNNFFILDITFSVIIELSIVNALWDLVEFVREFTTTVHTTLTAELVLANKK